MLIKRTLLDTVRRHLEKREMTLIVGPRQAGKTTLMKILEDELRKKGQKTLFLSLDFDQDRPFFARQEKLFQRAALELGGSKGYIFIDEIQRKENAGLFLKGLYDLDSPYKFIISGSGSIELKEKIHESLPGRKKLFELSTLSFDEFVDFKTEYAYTGEKRGLLQLAQYYDVHRERAREYLEEYLHFGGYPRVVLAKTTEEKRAEINDIYQSFLEKDIFLLLSLKRSDGFTNLVRVLASQVGQLVNIAELSRTLGLSVQTVREYLWYLEKTYIIRRVTPYFKNIRKEITKTSTYYFVDVGLRNYAIGQFGTTTVAHDGFLFENFVLNQIRINLGLTPTTIHFWRTTDKAEVDFVLNTSAEPIPIEVKYATLQSSKVSRSFRSFLTKYRPKRAYIVHLGEFFRATVEGSDVHFIPFTHIGTIVEKET